MANDPHPDSHQREARDLRASLEAVRRRVDDDGAWLRLSRILARGEVSDDTKAQARDEVARLSPTGRRRLWQQDCLEGLDSVAVFSALATRTRAARPHYHEVLREIHRARRPATYLEIGVRRGSSLRLSAASELRLGVDPEPLVPADVAKRCRLFTMSSDDFFAGPDLSELLAAKTIDLTFIDGMHLFEFALRDFMNAEARSGRQSMIVLHDCLPKSAVTASRERTTNFWTGDVWKLVHCLVDQRPELSLTLVDCGPSGLCLVEGLRPHDETLRLHYQSLLERYLPLEFECWTARWPEIAKLLRSDPSGSL